VLREAGQQFDEYFAGKRARFDLALEPVGTAFQQRVWRAIADSSRRRDDELRGDRAPARLPSSVRAVGAAIGRNPLIVVVPCHRIVGAGGALTGYAGGLERKRALLALEQR
jgi:methylated-DNA-[protein]-cysteine S-methyltransferase